MRPEKKSIVNEIRGNLEGSEYVILTDCRGLNAEKMIDLRGQLREAEAALKVVPNSLFGVAAKEVGYEGLAPFLTGPTAMVIGTGEITQVAKIIKGFVKTANKLPTIKGGYLTGNVLQAEGVQTLADLPSREVLQAMVLGTMAAPMTQLVGVMNQKVASLVYVLKAVAEKKEAGN